MKSQKGITLTTLVIYIIVVVAAVGVLITITSNFSVGVNRMSKEALANMEIDKFNVYFLKDVKKAGNAIKELTTNYVKFTNQSKYEYKENAIYYTNQDSSNIKITKNVSSCSFEQLNENEKNIIKVHITMKGENKERIMEYVLNNEVINIES